jgi:hypothetical protein
MFVTISRQSIKTPLRAKLKPTQPDPKPHGYEKRRMRLLPAPKINVFGCELCRLPAKQSRFAVQQSKPRVSLVGHLRPSQPFLSAH